MKTENKLHPIFSEILDKAKPLQTTPKAQHTAGEWEMVNL
jgi:hypothetical protein